MGCIEKRLETLGITLPKKDRRGKGVVAAREIDGMLYLTAQLPVDEEGKPLFVGRVGTDLTLEQGYQAARQCGLNALAVVADYVGDLDRVACVVKVLGLVNSGADFSGQANFSEHNRVAADGRILQAGNKRHGDRQIDSRFIEPQSADHIHIGI